MVLSAKSQTVSDLFGQGAYPNIEIDSVTLFEIGLRG